jgi:3D (Asp-Asp-Asp) domain-containing protein
MRRSALPFGIPVICALLGVTLIGAAGRADDTDGLPLAMAVVTPPTTRPAPPTELLVSVAPVSIDPATSATAVPVVAHPRGPRVVTMEVTAYCPCKKCCGPKARGVTASGKRVDHNAGLFVAADKDLFDFHTQLQIPGYAGGQTVPVLDRGGAIKGNRLDVFFPTHEQALRWGRRMIPVTVR